MLSDIDILDTNTNMQIYGTGSNMGKSESNLIRLFPITINLTPILFQIALKGLLYGNTHDSRSDSEDSPDTDEEQEDRKKEE